MIQYTNYCTEEQTRRAYKLGAPLEIFDPYNSNGVLIDDKAFAIPTTQQMIGWLREVLKLTTWEIKYYWYKSYQGWKYFIMGKNFLLRSNPENLKSEYNQTELTAIDAALDYLEKKE